MPFNLVCSRLFPLFFPCSPYAGFRPLRLVLFAAILLSTMVCGSAVASHRNGVNPASQSRIEELRRDYLGTSDAPLHESMHSNGRFLVEVKRGALWSNVGSIACDEFLREEHLNLGTELPKNAVVTLRLSRNGGGAAHLDKVTLGGQSPQQVLGASGEALKKLTRRDFDLLAAEQPIELSFIAPEQGDAVLTVIGRIEAEAIGTNAFMIPRQNYCQALDGPNATYLPYQLDRSSHKVAPDRARVMKEKPFIREFLRSGSGHPSEYLHGWVSNDRDNLYVTLDFAGDNTMDNDKDFAKVFARSGDNVREFKLTESDHHWGAVDFTYTPAAVWQHKLYEFRIPLSELDGDHSQPLQLAFSTYGTCSAGDLSKSAPELAHDSVNNRFLSVYKVRPSDEQGSCKTDIVGQLRSSDGYAVGSEFTIAGLVNASVGSVGISVAFDNVHGRFLVVWNDGYQGHLVGQLVNPDGSLNGTPQIISSSGTVDPQTVDIAFDAANSRFLAVWQDRRNISTSDIDIYGQLINADLTPVYPSDNAANFVISNSNGLQSKPAIAFEAVNGHYLVVWQDFESFLYKVRGQLIDVDGALFPSGDPASDNFLIATTETYSQINPDVAADTVNFRFLVAWQNAESGIYAPWSSLVTVTGNVQPPVGINTSGGFDAAPRLAYDAVAQEFLSVWQANSLTLAQRIAAADGTPVADGETMLLATTGNAPAVAYNATCNNYLVASEDSITNPTTIFYTTVGTSTCPDTIPPQVVATSPAADAIFVSRNSVVSITFNEMIVDPTASSNAIKLIDHDEKLLSGTLSYDPETWTLTFTPDAPLAPDTVYLVDVAGFIQDPANNVMGSNYQYTFTTAGVPPPASPIILKPGDAAFFSFDGGLPHGWSVIDNSGSGGWRFDDPGARGNLTGGSGAFAIADSDNICAPMNTELRTPAFDFTALSEAFLEFRTDFQSYAGLESAKVDVSIDNGVNWTTIWSKSGDNYSGPATETLDLSALAGQADVRIRFYYDNADCDWWWQVDDVRIYSSDTIAPTLGMGIVPAYKKEWGQYGVGAGEFEAPTNVAVDTSGNVYVADAYNNRVQKFDADGNYLLSWGSYGYNNSEFSTPLGIAVDTSGNVYVADSWNYRIQKFDSTGNYLSQWGTYGSGNGEFNNPNGIAIDPAGNIYVADMKNYRIQKFAPDGTYLSQWGSPGSGDGQFGTNGDGGGGPRGIAISPQGPLYAVDIFNNRIQVFDLDGNYLAQWDGSDGSGGQIAGYTATQPLETGGNVVPGGIFFQPYGVAIDPAGHVYVVDSGNNRVQKFTPDGNFLTAWGGYCSNNYESLPCNGRFASPRGIAVDSAFNVYVADMGNDRIEMFSPWTITSHLPNGAYTQGQWIDITVAFSEPVSSSGLILQFNSGGRIYTGPLDKVKSWNGIYEVGAGEEAAVLNIISITGVIIDIAGNSTPNPEIPAGLNLADHKTIELKAGVPLTLTASGYGRAETAPLNGYYVIDSIVQITAIPEPGYIFNGWSGDCTGISNPYSLTMDSAKSCEAVFNQSFTETGEVMIAVTPDSAVDFGEIMIGVSATVIVTITNNGSVHLSVNNMVLAGSDFALNTAGGWVPCYSTVPYLAPGTSCTVGVTAKLPMAGTSTGSLTISSDAVAMPEIVLALVANGVSNVDTTPPTVVISSAATDPTNTTSLPVKVTFSESVTGFSATGVSVVNGNVGNFTGSGTTYTFDVAPIATGLVTVDVAENVSFDFAGNGNSAAAQYAFTYNGHAPLATPPGTRKALIFDGIDDYVSIPNDGMLNANSNFTIEAWVNPASLASNGNYRAVAGGDGAWRLFLNEYNPSVWGLTICTPGCNAAQSSGMGGLQVNQWQHLAGTYDGSTIRIYKDGNFVASAPLTGAVNSPAELIIGKWISSFDGMIDEVRFWAVTRSQEEISSTMNVPLVGTETGLAGYWQLDDGAGLSVADSATNGRNGALAAAPAAPIWTIPGIVSPENSDLTISLTGIDLDGDPLTARITSLPTAGTLYQTTDGVTRGTLISAVPAGVTSPAMQVIFVPALNESGSPYASFDYLVNDGIIDSSAATITITISHINAAPVISGTPAGSVTQGSTYSFTPTAIDVDGDILVFSITNQPGWAAFDSATGALTGIPSNGDVGISSGVTIAVSDGTFSASLPAFSITVTNANDAPTATSAVITTAEDVASAAVIPSVTDPDTGDSHTFVIVTPPLHGTASIVDNQLVYTPTANYFGPDSFTFRATDSGGLTIDGTASVTVVAVNDAPVAADGTLTVSDYGPGTGLLVASDIDSSNLTYSIVTQGSQGTVTITDAATGAYSYTPNATANGTDSFTIKANDGLLDSNIATIIVNFTVNYYAITASAGANGTIAPAGVTNVMHGGSQTYTFTPDAGYIVEGILVDGIPVGHADSYTLENVTTEHTLSVIFSRPNGDIDGNDSVDIADAVWLIRAALGEITLDAEQSAHADVAPLVDGQPVPNGQVDLGDVVVLLRRVVGLATW